MTVSDQLLDAGADIWTAQKDQPFRCERAAGTLDETAFEPTEREESDADGRGGDV